MREIGWFCPVHSDRLVENIQRTGIADIWEIQWEMAVIRPCEVPACKEGGMNQVHVDVLGPRRAGVGRWAVPRVDWHKMATQELESTDVWTYITDREDMTEEADAEIEEESQDQDQPEEELSPAAEVYEQLLDLPVTAVPGFDEDQEELADLGITTIRDVLDVHEDDLAPIYRRTVQQWVEWKMEDLLGDDTAEDDGPDEAADDRLEDIRTKVNQLHTRIQEKAWNAEGPARLTWLNVLKRNTQLMELIEQAALSEHAHMGVLNLGQIFGGLSGPGGRSP